MMTTHPIVEAETFSPEHKYLMKCSDCDWGDWYSVMSAGIAWLFHALKEH